jgi:microcystin-dependent protein
VSEPFLGEIRLLPFNFAPRGWAFCQGQIMSIAQNTALFSLLGTTYGGNGQTTFALPDLRGRVAVSAGQGPGLSDYVLGEVTGSESVQLLANQLPAHVHAQPVSNAASSSSRPNGNVPSAGGSYTTPSDGGSFAPTTSAGNNQPFPIVQPLLVLNYCIALAGIFPSRN